MASFCRLLRLITIGPWRCSVAVARVAIGFCRCGIAIARVGIGFGRCGFTFARLTIGFCRCGATIVWYPQFRPCLVKIFWITLIIPCIPQPLSYRKVWSLTTNVLSGPRRSAAGGAVQVLGIPELASEICALLSTPDLLRLALVSRYVSPVASRHLFRYPQLVGTKAVKGFSAALELTPECAVLVRHIVIRNVDLDFLISSQSLAAFQHLEFVNCRALAWHPGSTRAPTTYQPSSSLASLLDLCAMITPSLRRLVVDTDIWVGYLSARPRSLACLSIRGLKYNGDERQLWPFLAESLRNLRISALDWVCNETLGSLSLLSGLHSLQHCAKTPGRLYAPIGTYLPDSLRLLDLHTFRIRGIISNQPRLAHLEEFHLTTLVDRDPIFANGIIEDLEAGLSGGAYPALKRLALNLDMTPALDQGGRGRFQESTNTCLQHANSAAIGLGVALYFRPTCDERYQPQLGYKEGRQRWNQLGR